MVAALLSGLSRLGEGEAAAVSMALCPAPLDSETAFYARMKLGVDAQDVRAKKLMNHLIDSYGHLRLFRIPKMRFDHPDALAGPAAGRGFKRRHGAANRRA
jgi:hypothetical protein